MIYRPNGTRWKYIKKHQSIKHQPYDYAEEGLLCKLLPPNTYNTKNKTTKAVFDFVDDICIRLLKYVEILKNFKNWNYNPN